MPGAQEGSAKAIAGGIISVASCLPVFWAGPPVQKLCVQLLLGAVALAWEQAPGSDLQRALMPLPHWLRAPETHTA